MSGSGSARPRCFLDIAFDGRVVGRIVVELRPDVAPKAVQNFVGLCNGATTPQGQQLCYRGLPLHRIIPGFMAQGGNTGSSIFGHTFEDESFALKHTGRGLLSLANRGPNTNNCQFFITFTATPHLDGKHVVFGQVIEGQDVVDQLESVGSNSGATSVNVTIHDCGQLS